MDNFDKAKRAGYKVGKALNPDSELVSLAEAFGDPWFLASIDGGNSLCRTFDNGWDVEVFKRKKKNEYCICLYSDYGCHLRTTEDHVKKNGIWGVVNSLASQNKLTSAKF